MQLLQTIAVHQ